jgi:hypothetical protein
MVSTNELDFISQMRESIKLIRCDPEWFKVRLPERIRHVGDLRFERREIDALEFGQACRITCSLCQKRCSLHRTLSPPKVSRGLLVLAENGRRRDDRLDGSADASPPARHCPERFGRLRRETHKKVRTRHRFLSPAVEITSIRRAANAPDITATERNAPSALR